MSLKRSGHVKLPEDIKPPKHITVLETLGVFGIHADYMAQFRDFLAEEGLPTNEDRIEFLLPVIKHLGTQPLKTIRLQKTINGVSTEFGEAFRKIAPVPTVQKPDPVNDTQSTYLQKNQVVLNWYPKIQSMKSSSPSLTANDTETVPNQTHFTAHHTGFFNLKKIYFELEQYKAERGWYNLNIDPDHIADLLTDTSWYTLLIPQEQLAFDSFDRIQLWEEIATALLKKYVERYYTFYKRQWELPHLEYRTLDETDPNFLGVGEKPEEPYYRILIDRSQEEIIAKLEELRELIETGRLKDWEFRGIQALSFHKHLYEPLLYASCTTVEISPVPLNEGEMQFIKDLKSFYESDATFFAEKELYLLRNLSKGKGVCFFEAGNFHPDFILWLLTPGSQKIIFVDPKGIRNISPADPKIQFYQTIKEIEERLSDPTITLESFIVSNTSSFTMKMLWNMKKAHMLEKHIVFQEEDRDTYIQSILK